MNTKETSLEIEKMYIADQASWSQGDNADLIRDNTKRFKEIFKYFGCITISMFGEKISHCAWLLVQHVIEDVAFQKEYLASMKASKDVLKRDIAYLTDRICIYEGREQIYGTQFDPNTLKSNYSPFPIKNRENVNARRKKMGLNSLEEYTRELYEKKSLVFKD